MEARTPTQLRGSGLTPSSGRVYGTSDDCDGRGKGRTAASALAEMMQHVFEVLTKG